MITDKDISELAGHPLVYLIFYVLLGLAIWRPDMAPAFFGYWVILTVHMTYDAVTVVGRGVKTELPKWAKVNMPPRVFILIITFTVAWPFIYLYDIVAVLVNKVIHRNVG